MRILLAHNFYKNRGGEYSVYQNEARLLEEMGHDVFRFEKDNISIDNMSLSEKVSLLWKTTWNAAIIEELRNVIRKIEPDLLHVHNFFPLMTPAIYKASKLENVPVVQTLHNFRILCANGSFLRNNEPCEKCLEGSNFNAIRYKCYRNSYLQSFAIERMISTHQNRNTWNRLVDTFICFTEFSKSKFVQAGIEADKIKIKPNFLPLVPSSESTSEGPIIFIGRFESAKGAETLLKASIKLPHLKFEVIGDELISIQKSRYQNINFNGRLPHDELINKLQKSSLLVFPSLCYEGMPMSIIEAFACSVPVIASNLGNMPNMVKDAYNGLLFETGNSDELAQKIEGLMSDKEQLRKMSDNCRQNFEERYTAESNYKILMKIYEETLQKQHQE